MSQVQFQDGTQKIQFLDSMGPNSLVRKMSSYVHGSNEWQQYQNKKMLCSVEEYDEVRFFVMLWYSLKLCDNNIEKFTLFWDKMRRIVSTTKQSTPCTSVQTERTVKFLIFLTLYLQLTPEIPEQICSNGRNRLGLPNYECLNFIWRKKLNNSKLSHDIGVKTLGVSVVLGKRKPRTCLSLSLSWYNLILIKFIYFEKDLLEPIHHSK